MLMILLLLLLTIVVCGLLVVIVCNVAELVSHWCSPEVVLQALLVSFYKAIFQEQREHMLRLAWWVARAERMFGSGWGLQAQHFTVLHHNARQTALCEYARSQGMEVDQFGYIRAPKHMAFGQTKMQEILKKADKYTWDIPVQQIPLRVHVSEIWEAA
jgi:hypothetical protein